LKTEVTKITKPTMRRFLFCGLTFVSICVGAIAAAGESPTLRQIAANDQHIVVMGRTEFTDGKVRMGYPGITIRFKYRGAAPTVAMMAATGTCFFNLSCNGWDPVLIHLKVGPNQIPLPTGIAPPEGWEIELVRRTESWMGTSSFDGLALPSGCELLAPSPPSERRLLFIGDSMTAGEYDERFPPEDDNTPRSTNAARSFGMLLGRWLHAQVHLVCYGGRGIMRDWSGKSDTNTAPVFFPRALPDEAGSSWDHRRYQPDVVVFDLGTDLDANLPDEGTFADAYLKFVIQVRSAHPAAFFLLCESGYQSDGTDGRSRAPRDLLRKVLQTVADRRHAQGDDRVRIVRSGYQRGTLTNPHVVAFQQEQIAMDLLKPIRAVTGW
jgi:hypothetical protein